MEEQNQKNENKSDIQIKNTKKKNKPKKKQSPNIESSNQVDQEEYIKTLTELYDREKESRCCFQLERDKLMKIRQIEKDRYDQLKLKLFEAEDKLLKFEETHQKEILNLHKKIKYLIGERDLKINNLKLELNTKSKINFKLSLQERDEYLNGISESIIKLNEDRLNLDDAIKNLTLENEVRISNLQNEYANTVNGIQNACEQRFSNERENFSLITRNAIHEISEVKNSQINEIKKIKDKSFEEMRTYFKELVQNLMDQVQDLVKQKFNCEQRLRDLEIKNNKFKADHQNLTHEIERLKKENYSLNLKSSLFEKNNRIFDLRNAEFSDLRKNYQNLDLKYEALLKINENLKHENSQMERYVQSLMIFKLKINSNNYSQNLDPKEGHFWSKRVDLRILEFFSDV
ncbi:Growth arrest-specific 8 [Brachionus plicatilis]|uniref:Growth arrest-specific 8 n=1 Tax=Brachionus plicatilis TaxID=10195 RepID=A0A3M7R3S7_BRAPC|nr:Growth arrest-specific 8 [Brachionus plicatilis]